MKYPNDFIKEYNKFNTFTLVPTSLIRENLKDLLYRSYFLTVLSKITLVEPFPDVTDRMNLANLLHVTLYKEIRKKFLNFDYKCDYPKVLITDLVSFSTLNMESNCIMNVKLCFDCNIYNQDSRYLYRIDTCEKIVQDYLEICKKIFNGETNGNS